MSVYKIIDKTSDDKLFKRLVENEGGDECRIIEGIVKKQKPVEVGDMFWIRDALIELGYELWKDFEIKKIAG